jgi:hypothetical protein
MEEIGDLIGKGFGAWKGNLNLCIPFLLSTFFSLLALVPFLLALLSSLPQENLESLTPQEWMPIMEHALPSLIPPLLGSLALLTLFSSFFSAGAIGMARQALEEGRSSTGEIWSSGRRNLVNLFLNTLLIDLTFSAGLLFLLPWALLSAMGSSDTLAIALLLAGVLRIQQVRCLPSMADSPGPGIGAAVAGRLGLCSFSQGLAAISCRSRGFESLGDLSPLRPLVDKALHEPDLQAEG